MNTPPITFARRGRRPSRAALLLAVLLSVLSTAAPALADNSAPVTTVAPEETPNEKSTQEGSVGSENGSQSGGEGASNGGLQLGDLANHYQSLAAGLMANRPDVSDEFAAFGAGFGLPSRENLLSDGFAFTIDNKSFTDLWEYTSAFNAQGGLDGKVATAAAVWATHLGALKVPSLKIDTFDVPELKMPAEALMFGLVYDQSLASLVSDSSVLSDVQGQGLGSPALKASWAASMNKASSVVSQNLGDGLISPCHGAFLAGMGGGKGALGTYGFSEKCSACATGGLYMHHEMNRLLDPTVDSVWEDDTDDIMTSSDYKSQVPGVLQMIQSESWQAQQLRSTGRVRSLDGETSANCMASLQVGKQSLSNVFGGVTSRLNNVK